MSNHELLRTVEEQLQILESLKTPLGKFFKDVVYKEWGLTSSDVRLVDEAGFGYTGIPIYGPELTTDVPHIDIAILAQKYRGPRSERDHPLKILFPSTENKGDYEPIRILQSYGIDVSDLIKGKEKFFNLPPVSVDLAGTEVFIPEPSVHVQYFAEDTILYYNPEQVGIEKLEEWFNKLRLIRDVALTRGNEEVFRMASLMLRRSIDRWQGRSWEWLSF